MKLNVAPAPTPLVTHEGGRAERQTPAIELERAVATCLLWENTFYEKGSDIAARISALVRKVTFAEASAVAIRARDEWKLRHVPLFLVAEMAAKRAENSGPITGIGIIADTLAHVIQRPDEMSEFLAIYWRDGKRPLSKQVKLGLARAMNKFTPYQLSKWATDREVGRKIKIRDALFLSHAKAKNPEQDALWKQLIEKTLEPADTWEVALSGVKETAEKRAAWERLIREQKLGVMALLMNLRNMVQAGVDLGLVGTVLRRQAPGSKALPFRFLTASRHAPALAGDLSDAMLLALDGEAKLPGMTYVVIDVSGSMDHPLSAKGETTRIDAAAGLGILVREVCERARIFTFSDQLVEVPAHRGIPLRDAIVASQAHHGTYLAAALRALPPGPYRVIVVTDEQSQDGIIAVEGGRGYLINVAPYKPGLDTLHGWNRINGFSERVLDWIRLDEAFAPIAG
jgi:hypothetical protein